MLEKDSSMFGILELRIHFDCLAVCNFSLSHSPLHQEQGRLKRLSEVGPFAKELVCVFLQMQNTYCDKS